MKLPLKWLKDYIQVPEDPKVLMDKMTSIGHMQDGPAKKIAGDTVYDLEIRQNRSDCLSILGLAREASAVLNTPVTYPHSLYEALPDVAEGIKTTILNPDLCYRFNTLKIENIKIAISPKWLSDKLEAYGIKSINNVVDITNFVMVELGEPMHAYDTQSIAGNAGIFIRLAKKNEQLTVLGNKPLQLTENDLVIADSQKIVALAGIIGGEFSGIKNDTTSIILEDATYNQATIRKTSIRHSMRTEASTRHEKFLHPSLTEVALKRAAQLIVELCGGTITGHTDIYPTKYSQNTIQLRISQLKKIGGVAIAAKQAQTILHTLEIPAEIISEQLLNITVPYWRTDVMQEADLIEEVVRVYGYDNIPATLPDSPSLTDIQSVSYSLEEKIRDIMISCGFDEQITEPLTNEESPEFPPVILQNSLNADKTMLRTTLKNSMINCFHNQQKYRKAEIRLFELGKIYYKENSIFKEDKMLAGIAHFSEISYAIIKGIIEVLFERLGYEINEKAYSIQQVDTKTFYFQCKLDTILSQKKLPDTYHLFTSPPQIILQDLSLLADQNILVGEVIALVQSTSQYVHNVILGENPQNLKDGKKSLFLKITFYSAEKTLTNEDVKPEREKIMQNLKEVFKITLR